MQASPLIPEIADWLYRQALVSAEIETTVGGLGERLLAGGVPVCRINVGGILLHPVLGAVDITWEAQTGKVTSQMASRDFTATEAFRNAPFFQMAHQNQRFWRFDLKDDDARKQYPIFENLAAKGITDYVAFSETFQRNRKLAWADLPSSAEGSYLSFSTKRGSGFDDDEVGKLAALSLPFSLALKVAVDRMLTITLLETYLGKSSGRNVYSGETSRGDGHNIDCVLWYSDLRNSTSLAASMELSEYLSLINDYYSCTAGSVLTHGGEVLKFIGDGVLAIFPYMELSRPLGDMANAAVMTSKDALQGIAKINAERKHDELEPISIGVGLHVGRVMFGNVGTEQRLDMTVTGPAVNEVTRYEALTKELNSPVLTSAEFKECFHGKLHSFGLKELKGLSIQKEVFGLCDLA